MSTDLSVGLAVVMATAARRNQQENCIVGRFLVGAGGVGEDGRDGRRCRFMYVWPYFAMTRSKLE